MSPGAFVRLSHFQAMVLFALLISIAFGTLGRRRLQRRIRYALWCFFWFLALAIAIGWLMYPFSH